MTETTASAGWSLRCQDCGAESPFGPAVRGCPACRERGVLGLLELHRTEAQAAPLTARRGRGLARYRDLLPIADPADWLSLGEGGTALVPSRIIGPRLGFERLFFKLEQQNPTLSFKDRFVAVTVNAARTFGFRRIAVSSTGNLGLSVAAYAAAAGMECLLLVPRDTPDCILDEASLFGARIVVLDKSIRFQALDQVAAHEDWFPVGLFLRRAVQNPFGIEGYRSFAYETVEELGDAPAVMMFPCARGNGLYGAFKGFAECLERNWSRRSPALVACQPMGANSLQQSLAAGTERALTLPPFDSIARSTTETVASDDALRAIRLSGGTALSAGEDTIRQAVKLLGEEGLNVEAGAALPVACLPELRLMPGFNPASPVVCVLTATGLRWPEQSGWVRRRVTAVDDLDAFEAVLRAR